MDAGKLDRRVGIYRAGPATDDGYTTLPGEMAIAGTRWARVVPMSGREVIEAAGKDGLRVTRFHFRWDALTSTLTEADELEHDGERYAITGPLIELGRRDGVEVMASTIGAL